MSRGISEGFADAGKVDLGLIKGRLSWWACLNQVGSLKEGGALKRCSPVGLEHEEVAMLWRRLQGKEPREVPGHLLTKKRGEGILVIQPRGNELSSNWNGPGRGLCIVMQPTDTLISALGDPEQSPS